MSKVRVSSYSVSLDGFGAAPGQDLGNPFGVGGMAIIDEMHLAVSPVVLGAGESPLAGVNLPALGYAVAEKMFGENAMHVFIRKSS